MALLGNGAHLHLIRGNGWNGQGGTHPASKQASQPASQQASQQASKQAREPASEQHAKEDEKTRERSRSPPPQDEERMRMMRWLQLFSMQREGLKDFHQELQLPGSCTPTGREVFWKARLRHTKMESTF